MIILIVIIWAVVVFLCFNLIIKFQHTKGIYFRVGVSLILSGIGAIYFIEENLNQEANLRIANIAEQLILLVSAAVSSNLVAHHFTIKSKP